MFSDNQSDKAIWLEYMGDKNGDKVPNPEEIGVHELQGDGDFRSQESIELLKQADIIGHQNALTYKEIFPLIKENKLWLGYGFKGGASHFINTHYEDYATATDRKEGMIRVSGVVWYTNLDIAKRHEDLILYKPYSPQEYPKYDNYDAIEVSKTKDIPMDYRGVMGVPITFMDKYSPEQFEILGATESEGKGFSNGLWDEKSKISQPLVNKERVYKRIFIRNKKL